MKVAKPRVGQIVSWSGSWGGRVRSKAYEVDENGLVLVRLPHHTVPTYKWLQRGEYSFKRVLPKLRTFWVDVLEGRVLTKPPEKYSKKKIVFVKEVR